MADQPNWVSALDVFSKLAIGAVGVFATLHFGNLDQRREAARDASARFQEKAADERELMRIFADYSARAGQIDTVEGRSALALASYAADRLAREYGRPEFSQLIAVPSQNEVASAVAENPSAASAIRNVALQAAEAAVPMAATDRADDAGRWFAVAGSYGYDDRAAAETFAASLQERLAATAPDAKVEVYSTRASRKLAVVVGGITDEGQARAMVAQLRADGLAPDAFAQRDRSWAQAIGDDAIGRLAPAIRNSATRSIAPRPTPSPPPPAGEQR